MTQYMNFRMNNIMKNILLLVVIAAVVSITGCNKNEEETLNNGMPLKSTIQSEMIPIAKLTEEGEIEHLFLQKDLQESYSKSNPDAELVFMEVMDYDKNGKEVGLLYRIYHPKSRVAETTLIMAITLEENIYYFVPGGVGITTTCTTSDCSGSSTGCQPQSDNSCSSCPWLTGGGKCTRSTSSNSLKGGMNGLTDAIQYAVSVY
jgi:hypothetical protein